MLNIIKKLQILITSRIRLTSTPNLNEEIILLDKLNNQQSAVMFKKITRDIPAREEKMLLKEKPDFEKYPTEVDNWPYKRFYQHHLFTLLNGNPQSINLVAPLLLDNEKHLDLVHLYRLLTSEKLFNELRKDNVEDSMMASLRISAQVSIEFISESD